MSLRKLAFVYGLLLTSFTYGITINKLNGGLSITNIDFSIPGAVIPLELARSYNSVTAVSESTGWNGAFGWGWTSGFETTLETTAEKNVILRDGLSGNNVIFHPGKEDPKSKEEFYSELKKAFFEQKLGRKISGTELSRLQWPEKVIHKLKTDIDYRTEMASRYKLPVQVPKDELLVSTEYGYQTLLLKGSEWVRSKDGVVQTFDKLGRITMQVDRNGHKFLYRYGKNGKGQLSEISDPDRSYLLKFIWRQDHVVEVVDNHDQRAKYTYDTNNNLSGVTDSANQSYVYSYENKRSPHLLTRIDYVSEGPKGKVFRELRYDENGLVTFHRDKDGSEISYQYGKSQSDPENNFWTKTTTKRMSKTDEGYDEYLIKSRADGSKYLAKQIERLNGAETATVFAASFGKPIQVTKNGRVTNFKYYDNGLLKERTSSGEDIRFEYDNRWNKVSKVFTNGLISFYEYDDRGNLVKASNSNKESVSLKYDKKGRVISMVDVGNKEIAFQNYNDIGKPTQISEKGVGTIQLDYAADGKVRKTYIAMNGRKGGRFPDSRSDEVVRKVMVSFQELLTLLKPAGVSLGMQ